MGKSGGQKEHSLTSGSGATHSIRPWVLCLSILHLPAGRIDYRGWIQHDIRTSSCILVIVVRTVRLIGSNASNVFFARWKRDSISNENLRTSGFDLEEHPCYADGRWKLSAVPIALRQKGSGR
jgi:hypothetical protein